LDAFRSTLKRVYEGELDSASDAEKDQTVRRLIYTGCAAAMVTTLQPIPLLDVALITSIHVGMVHGIGRIRGYHLDRKSALEILNCVKTGFVTQHATIAAAKFVPAAGEVAAACVAHGLTYAVGSLADEYFRTGRTMVPAAMRALFRRVYSEDIQRICRAKWNEVLGFFRGRGLLSSVEQRLLDVERARRDGRATDADVDRAIEDMVRTRK